MLRFTPDTIPPFGDPRITYKPAHHIQDINNKGLILRVDGHDVFTLDDYDRQPTKREVYDAYTKTYPSETLLPFRDPRITFTESWPDGRPDDEQEASKSLRINGKAVYWIEFDPMDETMPTDADMYKAYLSQLTQEAKQRITDREAFAEAERLADKD